MPESAQAEALDAGQYSRASILIYESVYGEDFVSPGGAAMATELIESMRLKVDDRVLDVGCGLGGSAFIMARRFGLLVDGIDLSKNMLEMARNKCAAHGLGNTVHLQHGDCLDLDHPGRYAGIYSRDVFLHIADKTALFSVMKRCLADGGRLLFTDYCCGEKPWSQAFTTYVEDRGYHLATLAEYVDRVAAAGFSAVKGVDMTHRFIDILNTELDRIAELEEPERSQLRKSWQGKLARCRSGDHRWGLVTAVNA